MKIIKTADDFTSYFDWNDYREKRNRIMIRFVLVAMLVMTLIMLFYTGVTEFSDYRKEKLVKENPYAYTYYLDGTEVDIDTIDLSLYTVKYDLDKHIVYLTRK